MRVDKPIGFLLLMWPVVWAFMISTEGSPNIIYLLIFAVGIITTRSAGCIINDYFDQEIIFNLNYNNNFDIKKQYLESSNWQEEYYKILEDQINGFVEKINFSSKKIPQYLEEALVNHPFLLDK